jgi:hypothetical protein
VLKNVAESSYRFAVAYQTLCLICRRFLYTIRYPVMIALVDFFRADPYDGLPYACKLEVTDHADQVAWYSHSIWFALFDVSVNLRG